MSRAGAARLAAVYAVVLICGTALVEGWRSSTALAEHARGVRAGETSRRVVGPAWILDVDRSFATAAKAFVAADGETYAFVHGPGADLTPLARRFMPTYLRGELLPAEPAPLHEADWLLCYGCDEQAREAFEVLWEREGYAIGRRDR